MDNSPFSFSFSILIVETEFRPVETPSIWIAEKSTEKYYMKDTHIKS